MKETRSTPTLGHRIIKKLTIKLNLYFDKHGWCTNTSCHTPLERLVGHYVNADEASCKGEEMLGFLIATRSITKRNHEEK
jgi:hypothetical protein